MKNQIDLVISEIEAWRLVTPHTYDDDGNRVDRPEGQYLAEIESLKDKTFFRVRALSRNKVLVVESPYTTVEAREEAVAKAFEHLGRSFFHQFLKEPPTNTFT